MTHWICKFLLVLICTVYTTKAALTKPTATVLSSNILEGDTIKLKCTYSNPRDVKYVVWYYNDQTRDVENILFGFNKEYPPHDGPSNGTNAWKNRASGNEVADGFEVTLKNVKLSDDNEVLCVIADNGFGRTPLESVPVPLRVAVQPTGGVIQNKHNLVAKTAEESAFRCISERVKPVNSVVIIWFLKGQQITSGISKEETLNQDGKTFQVTSVLRKSFTHSQNKKELACKVRWTHGEPLDEIISIDTGVLNVQFPPMWSSKEKTAYAEVNSKATLQCLVTSNPPITSVKWYKKGRNNVIHTGQNFTMNIIDKSNFTSYECEVENHMYPAIRYTVDMQESGPPQITEIKVLPNMTSNRATLKWVTGSDGGHPPVYYSIYIRRNGDRDFDLLNGSLASSEHIGKAMYYNVVGLESYTKYEYKIIAKNRRKNYFPDKTDTSMEMTATGITRKRPNIHLTEYSIHLDTLTVAWDYESVIKDIDFKNYVITVKIKYGVKGDYEQDFQTHPEETTLPVLQSPQKITNNFDSSEEYVVSLIVYENGFPVEPKTSPQRFKDVVNGASTIETWMIVVAAVAIVAILVVIVIGVILSIRCARKRKGSSAQRRYNDHYLLETNIYDELRIKRTPPKLPTRNSSQKEDPVLLQQLPSQNNNITALQTVYLTQQITPQELGYAPAVPPQTPVKEPVEQDSNIMEPLSPKEQSDYLVPVQTPPVNVQITVNQNNSPGITYGNIDSVKGPKLTDENGEELKRMLPNEEGQYLPMSASRTMLST